MAVEWLGEDTLVIEADEFSADAFICMCGDVVPTSDMVEVKHTFNTLRVIIPRCAACKDTSLCLQNVYGTHSSVVTPDDDNFRQDIVYFDPNPICPGQFWRLLVLDDHLNFPNNHQYGYCSACGQPMRWSPEDYRWVDWPEAQRRRMP